MLSRRIGALIAPVIAVLALAALVVVIWIQTPETTLTIEDPAGVVAEAELIRADDRAEDQRGDFELNTATSYCDYYDGLLTVEADGDLVSLDWAVEPVGECDPEACIPVWIIGVATPEFKDATFLGSNIGCPPELAP